MPKRSTPKKLEMLSAAAQERFWDKVDYEEKDTECWKWMAAVRKTDNLGVFGLDGTTHYAHRLSYFLTRGHLSDDMDVLRTCRNLLCVRPSHLVAAPKTTCRTEDEEDMLIGFKREYPM